MRAAPLLFLAFAFAMPFAAATFAHEVRYVVGTGFEKAGLFCFDASETVRSVRPDSIGGGCLLRVDPGSPIVLAAIDDERGDTRFFYDLRNHASGLSCAHGFVLGPFTLGVPAGCDEVTLNPEIGSRSGVVRVT